MLKRLQPLTPSPPPISFIALLSKEAFLGVPVSICDCYLALLCWHGVSEKVTGNGDTVSVVTSTQGIDSGE